MKCPDCTRASCHCQFHSQIMPVFLRCRLLCLFLDISSQAALKFPDKSMKVKLVCLAFGSPVSLFLELSFLCVCIYGCYIKLLLDPVKINIHLIHLCKKLFTIAFDLIRPFDWPGIHLRILAIPEQTHMVLSKSVEWQTSSYFATSWKTINANWKFEMVFKTTIHKPVILLRNLSANIWQKIPRSLRFDCWLFLASGAYFNCIGSGCPQSWASWARTASPCRLPGGL